MDPRLIQVCLTYVQRWNVWLLAAGYFVASAVAIQQSWFQQPWLHQPFFNPRLVNVSPDFPHPWPYKNVKGSELNSVGRDFRSLCWQVDQRDTRHSSMSTPFAKLVSLQIVGSSKSGDELQYLGSMPNLESLEIIGDTSNVSVKSVSELSKLRFLRMLSLDSAQDITPLSKLERLRTLDIMQVKDHGRLFQQLTHLPELRTLVVPGQVIAAFRPSDWEQLRQVRHLTQLYLRGNLSGTDNGRMELDRVQQILPNVKVRPSEAAEFRAKTWSFVAIASVFAWAILSVQLQTQFAHSGSCLIPHYRRFHVGTAVCIWCITTAFNTIILWRGGSAFSAGLAGTLVLPGILSWWISCFLQPAKTGKNVAILNPYFGICICMPGIILTPLFSRVFLLDVDWFLQGRQPLIAWGIVAASLAGARTVVRYLPGLYLLYQESPAGAPPLGTNLKEWSSWSSKFAANHRRKKQLLIAFDPAVHLDTLLATRHSQQPSRLWTAANGVNLSQICLSLSLTVFLALGAMYVVRSAELFDFDWPQIYRNGLMMSWLSLEGSSLGLIFIWRGRRPFLGYELLRPFTREEFVRQIYLAVFSNLWPLLALHVTGIGIALVAAGLPALPPLLALTAFCYCLLRGLTFYLMILLALAVKQGWWIVTGTVLLYTCDSMIGAYLMVACINPANNISEIWYPELTNAILLSGCVIVVWSLNRLRGYWQRIELA